MFLFLRRLLELLDVQNANQRFIWIDNGKEIDVTSEYIVQLIKGAIDLVEKGQSEDISKEYLEYAQEIVDKLIWNPGQLIHFEDPELIEKAKTALSIIWDNVDEEELFGEITGGGYGGILVHIIGDYIDRAKKLKPTLISVKPDNLISVYFQNAMNSWVFGLNSASIILCCSILEYLLKYKYPKFIFKYKVVNTMSLEEFQKSEKRKLEEFIDVVAEKGFIDEDTKNMAHGIRRLRNDAAHDLRSVTSDEAYDAIMSTKIIIETLLR